MELRPEGALAASVSASGSPLFAFAPLPAGALTPGIDEANLHRPDAVSAAIGSALDQVSPRTRAVTLILPDTVVRVFVLDFDSLPSRIAEAVPVARRLLARALAAGESAFQRGLARASTAESNAWRGSARAVGRIQWPGPASAG